MGATTRRAIIMDRLRELMAALDRRQPQHGRGEGAIVRDAAALRTEAATRVAAMEREDPRQVAEDDADNASPRVDARAEVSSGSSAGVRHTRRPDAG